VCCRQRHESAKIARKVDDMKAVIRVVETLDVPEALDALKRANSGDLAELYRELEGFGAPSAKRNCDAPRHPASCVCHLLLLRSN